MCLNPFHYEMVMELNLFAEKLTQIVTEGNEHTMTKMELNALMMWARDIHKARFTISPPKIRKKMVKNRSKDR